MNRKFRFGPPKVRFKQFSGSRKRRADDSSGKRIVDKIFERN
jgi:hypothetical protein